MRRFKSWKHWWIASSAILGGVYGLCAIFSLRDANLSPFDMTVSVAGGGILCACGAYAGWPLFCWFRIWQRARHFKRQTRPADTDRRKKISARLGFPFSQMRDLQFPRSAPLEKPFIELLVCDGQQSSRQHRSARRQCVSRDDLKMLLQNLLEDSPLE